MKRILFPLLGLLIYSGVCLAAPYEDDDEECGDLSNREISVDANVVTLQSPGFDKGSFSAGQVCVWVLQPASDNVKFVQINITDIDLPEHQRCEESFVEINYLDSIGPYLRYCGSTAKETVTLPLEKTPSITFFSSRVPYEGKGFKLTVQGLAEEFSCASNELKCEYPVKCIPAAKKCDGVADCYDATDETGCKVGGEVLEPKDVCGKPSVRPDTSDGDRIVGGEEAVPHSWPWQISIQGNYMFPSGHSCGGTLINSQWVLTAGHCVAGTFWKVLRVKLGAHSQFELEDEAVLRSVSLIFTYPKYNRFTAENDLALIKLNAPVKFTKSILPVCLPHYFEKEEIKTGTRVFATGWGETLVRNTNNRLRQVAVPVVDLETCRTQLQSIRKVADYSICTGYPEGGRNPCFGDSGGPLVSQKTVNNEQRFVLQGVVSWGPTVCGQENSPTVFVRVAESEYGEWIKETLSEN